MAKKKSKPVEKIRLSGRNIYTDKKPFCCTFVCGNFVWGNVFDMASGCGCLGSDDGDCGICFSAGIFEKAGSGKRCGF